MRIGKRTAVWALAIGLALLAVMGFKPQSVQAEEKSVTAKIPVSCEAENTDEACTFIIEGKALEYATIKEDKLTLKGGEEGFFEVECIYPGTYSFTVSEVKGNDAKTTYDETKYSVDLWVTESEDGTLSVQPIVYKESQDAKSASCAFKNIKETEPATTKDDSSKADDSKGNSSKGDGSKDNGSGNGNNTKPAKTADENAPMLWGSLMLAAILAGTFAAFKKRKTEGK